jgi:hypothetical protein
MAIGQDPDASQGQFVHTPPGGTGGQASFSFDLPFADTCYLWTRAMGLSWGANSFLISVDDGPEIGHEIPPFDDLWIWGWDQTQVFVLGPGSHTLRFRTREAGARLDALLLTNDPAYVPPLFLWRQEAEEGTLTPPMTIVQGSAASAGRYVRSATAQEGTAIYGFNVPATGNYYPWARARGLSWGENSFYVSVDGAAEFHYELPQFDGQWAWGWDRIQANQQQAGPLALSAGWHTLTFRGREPNARLDAVLLANDGSYVPSGALPTPTFTPSNTWTPTPTQTWTTTATASPPRTATTTPSPTDTPLPTSAVTQTPTKTSTKTATPTWTETPTKTATRVPTWTPTATRGPISLPLVLR